MSNPRLLVTGASGQLGRIVVEHLLARVPASDIAVAVRSAKAAEAFAARGVTVRVADYDQPHSFAAALTGIARVLLISSNDLARRIPQHMAVIGAARAAGVRQIAYTSLLHADTSPLGLSADHLATEAAIRAAGLPFVFLRNGWYTENYAASIQPALAHGAFIGGAGEGRISSAARADYAEAAAAVLASVEDLSGRVFELAGDTAYTLAEFAAELSRQAGKPIPYVNLPESQFKAALLGAGLPEPLADLLSNSDAGAAKGGLFDESRQLSALIGRPTTPLATTIAAALAG